MGARLLYKDALGNDLFVEVAAEGVFLGRAADCAVRTDDAMVSRKNCKISNQAGKWVVEDLGSSNGTYVNEQRVQKQALAHADVIRCGTLQVRFAETADAAQKPKPVSLEPVTLMAERDALAGRLQELSKELSARDRELDSLRDVIGQQERMLAQYRADGARASLSGATSPGMVAPELAAFEGRAVAGACPEARIHALEDELAKLATDLAIAQEATSGAPPAVGDRVGEITRRAEEACAGIHAALSELRTHILVAKDLVARHGSAGYDADAVRLAEAIEVSMDRTEDAERLLRSLREVVAT